MRASRRLPSVCIGRDFPTRAFPSSSTNYSFLLCTPHEQSFQNSTLRGVYRCTLGDSSTIPHFHVNCTVALPLLAMQIVTARSLTCGKSLRLRSNLIAAAICTLRTPPPPSHLNNVISRKAVDQIFSNLPLSPLPHGLHSFQCIVDNPRNIVGDCVHPCGAPFSVLKNPGNSSPSITELFFVHPVILHVSRALAAASTIRFSVLCHIRTFCVCPTKNTRLGNADFFLRTLACSPRCVQVVCATRFLSKNSCLPPRLHYDTFIVQYPNYYSSDILVTQQFAKHLSHNVQQRVRAVSL